jgi:hypothetical protein
MAIYDVLDDGKAEACAAAFVAQLALDAEEALAQAGQEAARNAGP